MSYNIRNGIGMDGVNNLQRVADVINACRPDVVAVQEVDSMTARSGRRDVLGELAALTGMMPVYAPAIDYDGGKYGVGILCRTQPLSVVRRALPGREESRMVVAAEFRDYVFACTHLSLTPADRMLSLPILQEVAALIPRKPFYLAGDFNAEPHEPFIRSLAERFTILTDTTVRTYPADVPDVTIDYIVKLGERLEVRGERLVNDNVVNDNDGRLSIVNYQLSIAPKAPASDHRPVCIDIIFKRK
ncbi:MAG: endonuclease/exonuclease/phosphatase family protein [Bacteroidaceae bacterium]|nr:endonuclease/exonuclease/phosphatase family protein [Bacteroidaceae bacterium]